MTDDASNGRKFQGMTEAQIAELFRVTARIEDALKRLNDKVEAINAWRFKVVGGAVAASAATTFVLHRILEALL